MSIDIQEEFSRYRPGQLCSGAGRWQARLLLEAAPAGVFVFEVDAGQCELPDAAGEVATGRGGFLHYDASRPANASLEYDANEVVRYAKEGIMAVLTEESVSDGDPVFVRHTAKGGNTQLGACRNDADGDAAETLVFTNALTSVDGITGNDDVTIGIDNVLFHVGDDGTAATAAAVAALMVAAIDAHADFAATDNLDGTFDVTRADGGSPGAIELELPDGVSAAYAADSDPATCEQLPGARFVGDHTTGVALVDFDLGR